jgi:hypothetical protein
MLIKINKGSKLGPTFRKLLVKTENSCTFYVRSARIGFAEIDPTLKEAAHADQQHNPGLDTRTGLVWGNNFVCREFGRHRPNHAAGNLSRLRKKYWGSTNAIGSAGVCFSNFAGDYQKVGKAEWR